MYREPQPFDLSAQLSLLLSHVPGKRKRRDDKGLMQVRN